MFSSLLVLEEKDTTCTTNLASLRSWVRHNSRRIHLALPRMSLHCLHFCFRGRGQGSNDRVSFYKLCYGEMLRDSADERDKETHEFCKEQWSKWIYCFQLICSPADTLKIQVYILNTWEIPFHALQEVKDYISGPMSLREVVLALCLQFSTSSARDELWHTGDGVRAIFLDASETTHTRFRGKWSLLFSLTCNSPCWRVVISHLFLFSCTAMDI